MSISNYNRPSDDEWRAYTQGNGSAPGPRPAGPTIITVKVASGDAETRRLRTQVARLERLLERREREDASGGLAALAHRVGLPADCAPADLVAAVGAALDRADALADLARQVVAAEEQSRRALVRMRVALRGVR